jgi:hypothetical protein
VKPYTDALQLLGKPFHPNFSKKITDRLLVSFHLEDSSERIGSGIIAIQAQIISDKYYDYNRNVHMEFIYFTL